MLPALRENPGTGKVHSVFDRVINVLAPSGQLVALAAQQLDDAPWTIRVELGDWSSARVQAGDPVGFSARQICFENPDAPTVALPGAREWFAKKIPLEHLAAEEFQVRSHVLAGLLDEHGVRGGILEESEPANAFEEGIAAGLRNGCEALVAAIRADQPGRIGETALQLLGLGPGLTPAGDDFLSGLALLAAQPGSRLGGAREVLSAVVGQHSDRTTLLSWTTLRESLHGRARESVLELLSQLFRQRAGSPAEFARHLRAPVNRALRIGHTSGTDILSGLLAGLRLETELRGSM
ncbi:oxamate carbamoyltransferase subunit AllH family protein [Arthrobacter sp. MMS24-S77]